MNKTRLKDMIMLKQCVQGSLLKKPLLASLSTVAEHLIRLAEFLKSCGRLRIVWVLVRMDLYSKSRIRDLWLRGQHDTVLVDLSHARHTFRAFK